jgi:hypothetical protein
MTFRSEMTCQYNEIIGPSWPADDSAADALWSRLEGADWFGEPPGRAGFSDMRRYSSHVHFGYFAVEHPITIVTYDDQKRMQEHLEESFEHIWFAIFLEEGRLVAQRRRFIHRDLNPADVVQSLETSLASLFGAAGLVVVDYKPFESYVTKEEFLEEFSLGGITEVQIDSLHGRSVPDAIKLLNPDIDRDAILKESYAHDNRHIAELAAKAAPEGDLSKTRLFKAEVAAGDPRLMKREIEGGTIVRHRVVTDTLEFRVTQTETRVVPTDDEIEEIVATVKGLPRPKRRPQPKPENQPSLFGEDDKSTE